MKKLSIKMLPAALFAACLILLTASCSSWDWSLKYSKTAKVDNMEFALNPEGKEAFVAACVWDGTDRRRRRSGVSGPTPGTGSSWPCGKDRC